MPRKNTPHNQTPNIRYYSIKNLVEGFLEDLGWKLESFKYIVPIDIRDSTQNFLNFPQENLPLPIDIRDSTQNFPNFPQENLSLPKFITPHISQYLRLNNDSHHIINDYIILGIKIKITLKLV